MKNLFPWHQKAIAAAKSQDWELAVSVNQEILAEDQKNLAALNRLALANMQLKKFKEAREALELVLQFDKNNKIALKNLTKIKKKKNNHVSFTQTNFIEEPGRARTISLIRIANKQTLDNVGVGQGCLLQPKKQLISIVTTDHQTYLGSLPENISQRLSRLISTGNEYSCQVQSVSATACAVHLEEIKVSDKNHGVTSFPIDTGNGDEEDTSRFLDEFRVKEDIPLEMINADGEADELEGSDDLTEDLDFDGED